MYTPEDLCNSSVRNVYFNQFQLHWVKLLCKYTFLVMAREKRNPDSCRKLIRVVQELDAFLEQQGYLSPLDLNSSILETFIGLKSNPSTIQERRRFIAYAINLWKEEEWLNIDYVGSKYKYPKSNIDVIPEETLVQIYNNLELFPAPLERLFRLQIALGWRICEMIMLPRNCLKFEREQWYTKRWIAKRKVYKFHPIHHLIVEVINEQQRFINNELGTNSDFDKLFCWMSAALGDGAEQSKKGGAKQLDKNLTRFEIDPVYEAKIFNTQSIRFWLRGFSKLAKLQDKDGKSFQLTSHMFRRTKASIMAHCEAEIRCSNSICIKSGPNNKTKGWVYINTNYSDGSIDYRCFYCKVKFNSNTLKQQIDNVINADKFEFDSDIWYLCHFYEEDTKIKIYFPLKPFWYKQALKEYIHVLLKLKKYKASSFHSLICSLRMFSQVIEQQKVTEARSINRESIKLFIDSQLTVSACTINDRLDTIKLFLKWLELDGDKLIRSRDYLKETENEIEWLDNIVRQGIKAHLDKIPAPIARCYLMQEYTAARPHDICNMAFECLIEENGAWYVHFYQSKVDRWHKIPADRTIRGIIEEQQKWIRESLGITYSYLFCNFLIINKNYYPSFPSMRTVVSPPNSASSRNPMVRIIKMLIENENILDANGQKPHFTSKITRFSRLQEVRSKHGLEAAQLYGDHISKNTTLRHYTPLNREEIAKVDLPFQKLLLNSENKFLPWQSLPDSLFNNPKSHELDIEISPRLTAYGYCSIDPTIPCPPNLYPKCYGCGSFRPSTNKLPLYERQYEREQQRMKESEAAGAELIYEEAKDTLEAMDIWLPALRELQNE